MKKFIGVLISTAAVTGGALMLSISPAHGVDCSSVAGYAKRSTNGATEYYADARCGTDPNPTVRPRSNTGSSSGSGITCRQYPDGELCGVGIGGPRTPLSHDTWRRLYGSPPPQGQVRVGAPVSVGGAGGGGGATGTVTVGEVKKVETETDAE